jgi:hypothetical protein
MPIKVFWVIAKTVVCIGCHYSGNNLLQQLLFADAVDRHNGRVKKTALERAAISGWAKACAKSGVLR